MTTYKEYDVAMTKDVHNIFDNLKRDFNQERLTFFYWRPSIGKLRYTVIIEKNVPIASDDDFNLTGNVSYKLEYFLNVISNIPSGCGVGLVHNHFTTGWQSMSYDDEFLESNELLKTLVPLTGLPFIGMTMGIDGFVSARIWNLIDERPHKIEVRKVRIVDESFNLFYHPKVKLNITQSKKKLATKSVWGDRIQSKLEDVRIGIVGLGSVGSIVADGLAHIGVRKVILIDPDCLEFRNLDRTHGAKVSDVYFQKNKVSISKRNFKRSCTSKHPEIRMISKHIEQNKTYKNLLDCDFVFSCVDKHYPRYILNFLALSHLIPVIDGGVLVDLRSDDSVENITWREHLIAPNRTCLSCLNAFTYDEVLKEIDGLDVKPAYINVDGKPKQNGNDNIYSFSLNLASNELNLFLGYFTSTMNIMEYRKNRQYHAFSGITFLDLFPSKCHDECLYKTHTSNAHDLSLVVDD